MNNFGSILEGSGPSKNKGKFLEMLKTYRKTVFLKLSTHFSIVSEDFIRFPHRQIKKCLEFSRTYRKTVFLEISRNFWKDRKTGKVVIPRFSQDFPRFPIRKSSNF